ncbi:hypothetical protein ACU5P1_14180 [Pseudomonas plecoglossicida]|uniref:Uncharacterized protein n=1 Tax=Pseudomonas plecoglossicida TaxID=70775 RepID=A0AAD0VSK2_PSEDL|nr:hypothetical protein [Pseudomonas plecoglossicida]AXM95112.1 hypothetical protein DVB73_04470 [Pseudomonas plecoglossicida]EPB96943.1 hypothetical protein L321_05207 [Pseudomonas plecoglossicida NB2011]QLB55860.1 hypothetical protein HAV28_14025 [Pseudomonas plecoglossicida]GLR38536.1 hypothetical protein GCM10011247_39340 [Pseudomonas plecoglossicida]
MTQHHFQLAYTIKPRSDDDEGAAAQARLHLREIGWDPLPQIETTLLGEVHLYHSTIHDRIDEAQRQIRGRIHEELKGLKALTRVKFYGSLMVDGLGPAIRFSILA